jgi:hypothetical protein
VRRIQSWSAARFHPGQVRGVEPLRVTLQRPLNVGNGGSRRAGGHRREHDDVDNQQRFDGTHD